MTDEQYGGEVREVSVTLPESLVEELSIEYPHALNVSDAVRLAVTEAVRQRQLDAAPESLAHALAAAAERGALVCDIEAED